MPHLIKHIDEIARAKQRDVLAIEFIEFDDQFEGLDAGPEEVEVLRACLEGNWEDNKARKIIIKWLEEKGIPYFPADTSRMGV